MDSLFDHLKVLPPDPILGLAPLFKNDPRPGKVNLGIGTYMDGEGKPLVFEAVRSAERSIDQKNLDKEYQPIDGDARYKEAILELLFGDKAPEERTAVSASIGGSGAIRLAGDFLDLSGYRTIAVPVPTWSNHLNLLNGHAPLEPYPYYDAKMHRVDFEAMLKSLQGLPKKTFVLLHTCCHNPTGEDLNAEQWKELASLMKKQELFPLFDLAYHGYKAGIVEDRAPFKLFLELGLEFIICYSLSKSLTLYGERVGALVIVSASKEAKEKIVTQVKALIRRNYSSPPLHGTRIVQKVLFDKELRQSWEKELATARMRLKEMRKLFGEKMPRLDYVDRQNGLFSLIGLTKEQVLEVRERFGVYLLENGRINFAGLNESNIDYTTDAIKQVMR